MNAQTSLLEEITVDNFAGGGGASTGIELATGRPVNIAVNHDPAAVAMHRKNHRYTEHFCESVWEIDPKKVCRGRPVGLAWFSPDCKHFSRAKGGKPVEKKIRGLAWIALRWAGTVRPRVIILENVEEFQTWGPLRRGKPVKSKQGQTFEKWKAQLVALGYRIEHRMQRMCDHGAPTIRNRFFLIARCDNQPIVWPQPTHGDPTSEAVRSGKLLPWRTAAECIDFTLPCKSIFGRKKPLADNTMKRIARGTDKLVLRNPQPFIVQVNHGGGFRGQSIDEPIQTITAKNGYGVADPKMTPYVMYNNGNNIPSGMDTSVHTVTTENGCFLTAPVMVPIGYGERKGQQPRINSVHEPISTIVSSGKQYLVAPSLIQYHSETSSAEVRGQTLNRPLLTIDTSPRYALVAAHLAEWYGNARDGLNLNEPLHTITTKDREAIVESHLCVLRNNMGCKNMREPLPTVTTSAGHFAEVRTYMVKAEAGADLKKWPLVRDMLNEHCGYALAEDDVLIIEIKGTGYFISDIGLRMLKAKELFRAQGFPPDYIIDFNDEKGRPYPEAAKVARCGNSVCPVIAAALVRANLPELCTARSIETMAELERMVAV